MDYLSLNTGPTLIDDIMTMPYFSTSEYYQYLAQHERVYPQGESIIIRADAIQSMTDEHAVLDSYSGRDEVLLTEEQGTVTWEVLVPEKGFYWLRIHYYPYPGKSAVIERSLAINGEVPFDSALNLTLPRIWGNEGGIVQDIHGNDIRPRQVEQPMWTSALISDPIGYVNGPYTFHFEQGLNTITLTSVREPLLIDRIEIVSVTERPNYDQVMATYESLGYTVANEQLMLFQGQEASHTTSPTLYPLSDRTSPLTMPSDPTRIKLNSVGGYNWRVAGDSITWTFEVETSGLYAISMRVKQKQATGMNVHRNIYINGEIPFRELENYAFVHHNDWRIQTLGTPEEPYLFYFEAGQTHTLTMEVSLGHYGPLIAQIQSSIANLNKLYREILIYTGPEPDPFRDYQLETRVDNLVGRMREERENLHDVREQLIDIAGSKSEKTGILDTVILQLDEFLRRPREVHRNLLAYNSNISSLGTLMILLSAQPLEIDYFAVHDPMESLPRNRAFPWTRLRFALQSFLATFTTDYAAIGKTEVGDDEEEAVEVWLSVGRDQANILRRLIDESFTRETGISIDLKLVDAGVLLPATLSGVGPDVALGQGNAIPVNYALRNAAYDLTQFSDFDEISERFMDSAIVPYYHEGGVYALPEQQIFLMMFYRTDIFDELGLVPPDTWHDVIQMIPDLQKLNLEFFLPVPMTQGAVIDLPPNPIFASMFYQQGGHFYLDNNRESGFNDGMGPQVFELWTQFYTDYSFPVEANFVNRFRSGQMPIGITHYNTYNVLSVFAPEIRGRWNFLPIPGTWVMDEMGEPVLRRDTVAMGTGAMIMNDAHDKDAAWEFLKWWTSTEVQVRFGREMEGILGAAARYPTANVEAMAQLPWTVREYEKLYEQWEWVRGIPEVPGSYMTGRHLDNAFRLVLEERTNPRETLYDYVMVINEEINKKRREFGLD